MTSPATIVFHSLRNDLRLSDKPAPARKPDYDVNSNQGNWRYIAGRGTDPRGGCFDPERQARMHDPQGAYQRQRSKA